MPRLLVALAAGAALFGSHTLAADTEWLSTWSSSQYVDKNAALPDSDFTDATLRQIVHISVGGETIRVHISNQVGSAPLKIDSVHIALAETPKGAKIKAGTDHALTFAGQPSVIIPQGGEYISDPIKLSVPALSSLAISLYVAQAPAVQTSHPGSRATSYAVHGNHVGDADLESPKTFEHWYQISAVDVPMPAGGAAIVALGDSITDGRGVTTDGDNRWTDRLSERLQENPKTKMLAVLNQGIGGNRILNDGNATNALARFNADVIAQIGARYLIILEGINDLGTLTRDAPVSAEAHAQLVARIIGAYSQMIDRAHAHGIKVMGATILADGASGYYHPDAQNEADRAAINAWIKAPGHFDAYVDFDAVTRDPADPKKMRADFDVGDGLHPNPAGYKAMGDAIPLSFFEGK